mgnify:CR=1 FL=1
MFEKIKKNMPAGIMTVGFIICGFLRLLYHFTSAEPFSYESLILREFISESKRSACGYYRIIKLNSAKIYLCVYHIISSLSSTGPSRQILLLPYLVLQEQPIQAPNPQPILSSKLKLPPVFEAAKKCIPVEDMIDRKAKAYTKLYMDYIDELKREPTLFENPELFATPIVRNGKHFTLGFCPDIWKTWE